MTTEIARETKTDEWLSLQEASALLGITTSTLRRWGDSGRVPMKRTLGGHRRFPREGIQRLVGSLPSETVQQESPPTWDIDIREMMHHDWHSRFSSEGPLTDRMRGLGQRLLGLLMQYINRREGDTHRFLLEARAVGARYGSEAREAKISLHDSVEAFLYFRGAFSHTGIPIRGMAQPTDVASAMKVHEHIDHFMDAILLGMVAGYEGEEEHT